ncbi:MAG: NrpR regulatory domain-containing protein [Dehalococcoidia bacterium]|nr:NrpR regulatory domain-containing protein [Dehalococcoidia bacterium]
MRDTKEARVVHGASTETERKVIAILKVLSESSEPLGSITIARELERHGIILSERAVRYHLRITDERGYTQPLGRDGRMLTPQGMEELRMALAPEQVGFILDKLELLAFKTTFDPRTKTGLVPVNTSLFDAGKFNKALAVMKDVFKAGLCVSDLVITATEGKKLGSVVVPAGKIGLGTVCGVVINGVLLKSGIPIESRFGGVLEVRDHKPRRFVAIISYAGTSLDPSEQYIRAKMTSVNEAARTGNGKILANFREIPASARAMVENKAALLKSAGINGVFLLGNTSESVCQISVGLSRVGMVLLGGLNPVAAAAEAGIEVDNIAESGLVEYEQLVSVRDL